MEVKNDSYIDKDGELLTLFIRPLHDHLSYLVDNIVAIKFNQIYFSDTWKFRPNPVCELEVYDYLLEICLKCLKELTIAFDGDYQFFLRWVVNRPSALPPFEIQVKILPHMCNLKGRRNDYNLENFDKAYEIFANLWVAHMNKVERLKDKVKVKNLELIKKNLKRVQNAENERKGVLFEMYELAYSSLNLYWADHLLVYTPVLGIQKSVIV